MKQVEIKFLNFAFCLLIKQKQEESINLKKLMKGEVDCNFVEEDDSDNEENESSENRIEYSRYLQM